MKSEPVFANSMVKLCCVLFNFLVHPSPGKILSFLLLMLMPTLLFAQSPAQKILGTFVYEDVVYNYEFVKADINNYSFDISLSDVSKSPDSVVNTLASVKETQYLLYDFNKDAFVSAFQNQMNKRFKITKDTTLRDKGVEVYFSIQKNLEFTDDEPVTGNMILKRDSVESFLASISSATSDSVLTRVKLMLYVKSINIETEDGAMKNIIAHFVDPTNTKTDARSPRKELVFLNTTPVSVSGKHDPERFSRVYLYCFNCGGVEGINRYVKLSDLIFFDIQLDNDKEDYSPSNRTFSLMPQKPVVQVQKEKRSRIIDVSVFSDFVGLDQEQPNGLVQVEAKRKINIVTKYSPTKGKNNDIASRYDLNKFDLVRYDKVGKSDDFTYYHVISKDSVIINGNKVAKKDSKKSDLALAKPYVIQDISEKNEQFKSGYYNFFSAIEPKLLFSKIDGNNRFLLLNKNESENRYIEPIKQFQHQLVSSGLTLNFFKLYYPQKKLTWNVLDIGAFWYRTRVQNIKDTATNNSIAINNGYISIATLVTFRPEGRWGVNLGATYIKQEAFSDEYKFRNNLGLVQGNFDAFIKTNTNSKLFFRYRWIFDEYNFNKNYTQVQLGYAINIFANGEPKLK